MKNVFILWVVIMILLPQTVFSAEISAESAVLLESVTGKVLYEKNASQKMPMASTTKIMTALLAIEKGDLSEEVTISTNAASQEGSSMYLKAGEVLPLGQLVEGLMLASGNDAAVAIAEHIAGDVDTFSEMMTTRAIEMGCQNTQFKNPNGLPAEGHYTTARELAEIAREALRNAEFCRIVSQKTAKVGSRYLTNHNKLLSMYEGAIGVKTGFTKASGRTLVSAAERDGVRLIAVTLNAPDDWNDHIKMLDEGFSGVQSKTIIQKGTSAGEITVTDALNPTVPVIYESDFTMPLTEADVVEVKTDLNKPHIAPIPQGEEVGVAEVFVNREKVGEVKVLTAEPAEKKPVPTFWERLCFVFECWAKLLVCAPIAG